MQVQSKRVPRSRQPKVRHAASNVAWKAAENRVLLIGRIRARNAPDAGPHVGVLNVELDAPVLLPALGRPVVLDRLVRTEALRAHSACGDAVRDDVFHAALGAIGGELLVHVV